MELKRAPLRVRPIKGEPAYSLFGRLAARNRYDSCRAFAKDQGLKYNKGILIGWMLEDLAIVSGIDVAALQDATVVYQPGRIQVCGQELDTKDWTPSMRRVCPDCLDQDFRSASRSRGPITLQPYRRTWWDVTVVEFCPIHLVKLIGDCPRCAKRLSSDTPLPWRCTCGFDLSTHRTSRVNAIDCLPDRYIVGRLGGCAALPVFALDRLPLHAVTAVLQQIGRAALHGREYRAVSSTKYGGVEARSAGLKILRSWPTAFYDLLDELVAQRNASKEGIRAGMTGMYGDLYRWLYANPNPELDLLRNALKRHAKRRVVTNDAASAFGGSIDSYHVTLGTVISHCGSPEVKTYLFAMHLGYIDASQPILRSHPIPRSGLEKIQAMLLDEIDTRGAASYLGTSRLMLKKLCDQHMIEVFSLQAQGRSLDVLLRSSLDKFLDKLSGVAPDIETPPEGAKTIVEAARESNLNYLDLIQLIFDGKIRVLGRRRAVQGLSSLFVDLADVLKVREVASNLCTLWQAAERFRQSYNDIRALTLEGAIPSIPNPSTRNPSRLVRHEDCQKFFQEHASLWELAARFGQSPNTVARILSLVDVEPLSMGSRCSLFYTRSSAEIALSKWDWTVDLRTRRLMSRRLKAEERSETKSHFDQIEIPSKISLMSPGQAKACLQSHFQSRLINSSHSEARNRKIEAILKSENGIYRVAHEVLIKSRFIAPDAAIQFLYLIHASAGQMSVRQMHLTLGGCRKAAGALYSYILNDVGLETVGSIITSIMVDPTVLPTAGDPMTEPQETLRAVCLRSSEPQELEVTADHAEGFGEVVPFKEYQGP